MAENCYVEASRHADVLQAKEVELALRSGVHTSVSWSLNVLTVLSFNAPHQLLLSDLPELLQALLQVQHARLHAFTCVAVFCMLNSMHKPFVKQHFACSATCKVNSSETLCVLYYLHRDLCSSVWPKRLRDLCSSILA